MGVPVRWLRVANPRYEVSSSGLVRRVVACAGARAGRVLRPEIVKGYARVTLGCGSRDVRERVLVHLLVLRTFVGLAPADHEANHKNGNKLDNRVENLEWVTRSENCKHRDALPGRMDKRRGEHAGRSKLTEAVVRRILAERMGNGITIYTLAEEHGISPQQVSKIRRRERWAHLTPVEV